MLPSTRGCTTMCAAKGLDFAMPRNTLYGDRDPRDIAAYPQVEAARYAGVPLATLRRWVGEREDTPAVIELPEGSAGQLSFYNLVEAFVLGALRRRHHIPLQQLRKDVR